MSCKLIWPVTQTWRDTYVMSTNHIRMFNNWEVVHAFEPFRAVHLLCAPGRVSSTARIAEEWDGILSPFNHEHQHLLILTTDHDIHWSIDKLQSSKCTEHSHHRKLESNLVETLLASTNVGIVSPEEINTYSLAQQLLPHYPFLTLCCLIVVLLIFIEGPPTRLPCRWSACHYRDANENIYQPLSALPGLSAHFNDNSSQTIEIHFQNLQEQIFTFGIHLSLLQARN